jgi:hypothetical protein
MMWLSPSAQKGRLFWIGQVTAHLGSLYDRDQKSKEDERLRPQQSDRGFQARAPLHLTLGAWTHQGEVVSTPSTTMTGQSNGQPSGGIYLTGDLSITRFNRGSELGLGFQAAFSPAYYPLHASVALTVDDLIDPILWSKTGLKVALGLSHIGIDEAAQGFGLGTSSEELIELSLALPISPYVLFGLTGMSILMEREHAHLIISRLTVGIL